MLEQLKELCLFMICGQTLLYFQSGKKYEKICRMILELLILAGIVGMILNFLQSLGFRKGEMETAGGAVAGMRRSMEEALSKQLGIEGSENDLPAGEMLEGLIERRTSQEIKTRYNHFAKQYGFEIQEVKKQSDKLQVFLKTFDEEGAMPRTQETQGKPGTKQQAVPDAGNPVANVEIEQIEIKEILPGEDKEGSAEEAADKENREEKEEERSEKTGASGGDPETFRRQFALLLVMEEEKLEVILLD